MALAVGQAARFVHAQDGGWRFRPWASSRCAAGVTDRRQTAAALAASLGGAAALITAEQVHGAGIAVIGRADVAGPIAGCDALLTALPDVALGIRSADCLPVFFADPVRGVVGLAHAGWRGLAAELPLRMIAAFRHAFQSPPGDLHVAIGPAIRACCYEVGADFPAAFAPFLRREGARRTCDLIGAAIAQLRRGGVRADRITDAERCTACDATQWFSLRREGPQTGRLSSLIMWRG